MAAHTHTTYTCDLHGCQSRCQLLPECSTGPTTAAELARRGWTVTPDGRHFCPVHAAASQTAEIKPSGA